ncbi:MAG: hypothetical protein ACRDBG_19480 [Waterburya sp.]
MKHPDLQIPISEDIATEVLALASRYYAEKNQGYTQFLISSIIIILKFD